MNKKKFAISIISIMVIFAIVSYLSFKKSPNIQKEPNKQLITVSAKSMADSKSIDQEQQYPASVLGDQEIEITSKSAGTVMVAPGDIGSKIAAGSLLSKIDDTGALDIGEENLRNLQVQQAENSVEQAKKAYDLAKDNYDHLKDSSTATDSEIRNAKTQRNIAKLQYENAKLGLAGSVDNHLITSPISGVITRKAVSVGDSVSVGQLLATVSKSSNVKIQFFVDLNQRNKLTRGQEILATDSDKNTFPLFIQNISATADQTTKRFLIEAYPKKPTSATLLSGTIVSVSIKSTLRPKNEADFLLPLSAISIGQNENFIFIIDHEGNAKKVSVNIIDVIGEIAEVSAQVSPETPIIINGNKLINDGEKVNLKN